MGEEKFEEERFMKALVNLKETQESIQVCKFTFCRNLVGFNIGSDSFIRNERELWSYL